MNIEFTVSLVELKRAFRRMLARLPDESEAGAEFVVFNASDNNLEITASGTSEGLSARGPRTFWCRGRRCLWNPFTVHWTPKHGSWLNQAKIAISQFSAMLGGCEIEAWV
jgi:hypothetical protein